MSKENRIAHIDCFSGISGDMFLGALLDAGLSAEKLQQQLDRLDLAGYELSIEKKDCGGIAATALRVSCRERHPHRNLADIRRIIEGSDLAQGCKTQALAVFTLLAEAEAKVHGTTADRVHFHEVGAVDALIDIVGAAIGLATLEIGRLSCAPFPMPSGWVECAHGRLPLPAPAVCELLKGVPAYGVDLAQELVTPTGAALAKALAADFGPMPAMRIDSVGYGAGSRALANGQPNLLRLLIGTPLGITEAQEVEVMETHLDDWAPETYPYLCERLFASGALDVALMPIQMKKGRPGFALRVVCAPAAALALKECILTETTAIGLRFRREQRLTLPRESGTVPSRWGKIRVKKISAPSGETLTPEYEDCKRLATAHHIPLKEVYAEVARAQLTDFRKEE
ncbi:nickel pincer cofactor biosynthesis protein LarC [Thiovibrio sp. JS02]